MEERLYHTVYGELRRIAGRLMRRERAGHTLQPTDLVHEAYLRLVGSTRIAWQDRDHFFATAAVVMRRILIDRARARRASKRGGQQQRVPLESGIPGVDGGVENVIAIDEALTKLSQLDPRMGRVVELRFFGGMEMEAIARVLNCSKRTVAEDWRMARRWLKQALAA